MSMHIRDYVAKRKAELEAFEKDWYEQMKANPEGYPFDTASYPEWFEQEEAFWEMQAE